MSDTLKRAGVAAAAAAAETVNLNRNQVTDIAANLPPPAAMESLLPQLGRQLLVAVGGVLVAKGVFSSEDWALYSGAVAIVAPIGWRIATTLLARRGLTIF